MAGKTSIIDDSKIERAVAKATITVGGVERKVSKIMQTVDGVWRNVYSSGIVLKYTGTTNLGTNRSYEFDDGEIALKFLTSGTLTVIDGEAQIEVFCQGGGYRGSEGGGYLEQYPEAYWFGGRGGDGGYHANGSASMKAGDSFYISVGDAGENTTAFGVNSSSGTYSAGGQGANRSQYAENGENGVYAFNDSSFDGIRYGGGGGGGGMYYAYQWSPSVSRDPGAGGLDGGGSGNAGWDVDGYSATANRGGGGGGGCGRATQGATGGYGSSGIAIIRSKKEAA